jgi:copper homeostasis protein CutC
MLMAAASMVETRILRAFDIKSDVSEEFAAGVLTVDFERVLSTAMLKSGALGYSHVPRRSYFRAKL